jgi:hypothetical protein
MGPSNRVTCILLTSLVLIVGHASIDRLAFAATPPSVCADTDGNGNVTVTDGVLILRAAAELPSTAPEGLSDLNLDGQITVTDGVLALRAAAELPPTLTCPADQARLAQGRTTGILEIGIAAVPAANATAAIAQVGNDCPDGPVTPCPGGGQTLCQPGRVEDQNCREGEVVTNGVILISAGPPITATFDTFSATNLLTSETISSSGGLELRSETGDTVVDGTLTRSSNLLGEFTERLTAVRFVVTQAAPGTPGQPQINLLSGTVSTTVTAGRGAFANVQSIELKIAATTLAVAILDFTTGVPSDIEIIADSTLNLCQPCEVSNNCTEPLACTPCTSDCTGVSSRCSIAFENFAARCVDGLF